MRSPFRPRPPRQAEPAAPVRVTVERLPEVTVRHVIERKIPRPTSVTFWVDRPDGSRYCLTPMDLSYRQSVPVVLPLRYITGQNDAPDVMLRAELHYDSRDQS